MKSSTRSQLLVHAAAILLPAAAALVLALLSFASFTEENRQIIQNNNKDYIEDFALSVASTLDRKFADAQIAVEAIAGSVDCDALCRGEETAALLLNLENETQFDHVRFVDTSGISHTSAGISKDISFREYYQDGMQGNSGITHITDSVLTNERQIGFYAPIIRDGQIRGEIVVFYQESTLVESLSFDFYGERSSVAIINSRGEVLVNSPSPGLLRLYAKGLPENVCDQAGSDILDAETGQKLRYAYEKHVGTGLEIHANGSVTVGYVAPLAYEDLSIYMIFPYQANTNLYNDGIAAGRHLQTKLTLIFIGFALWVVVFAAYRVYVTLKKNQASHIIAQAEHAVSKGLFIIHPAQRRVENYSDLHLPKDALSELDALEQVLKEQAADDEERAYTAQFLAQIRSGGVPDVRPVLTLPERNADGDPICHSLNYVPVEEKDGAVSIGVIQIRDVTHAKKMERISQESLQNALAAAKSANNAKSTFLFSMSHDIRTPMNAILGFAELMEKKKNDPAVISDYLQKIRIAGEYLLSIINNVLDMARIESGNETIDESLMDLLGEEARAMSAYAEMAGKKHQQITVDHDIQHRYILVDCAKLQEIMMNLLSNAIKYTPEGGSIRMVLDELPCSREGYGTYRLRVSDNGIGMSEEFQEKLFDAFTREKNTTDSQIAGTGLGMAIVKRLVDLLGGTIAVDSQLGKGTTFTVTFDHRIAEDPQVYLDKAQKKPSADLAGRRILLAEDNDLNAEIATEILTMAGMAVERAEDGVICVDKLCKAEAGHFDLILMDIQMPNLDGYGAAKRIRAMKNPVRANIPIVAMTANAFAEDKRNALAAGMNAHLAKPIDIPQLMQIMAELLDR